jgi:hypothetical protein
MQAFSEETGTTYPDFDALVAAEANGYVVTAIINNGKISWPWTIGPFDTKKEATNARARLRTKLKREQAQTFGHVEFSLFVRPLWKDKR